jgi:hypothetical protein
MGASRQTSGRMVGPETRISCIDIPSRKATQQQKVAVVWCGLTYKSQSSSLAASSRFKLPSRVASGAIYIKVSINVADRKGSLLRVDCSQPSVSMNARYRMDHPWKRRPAPDLKRYPSVLPVWTNVCLSLLPWRHYLKVSAIRF